MTDTNDTLAREIYIRREYGVEVIHGTVGLSREELQRLIAAKANFRSLEDAIAYLLPGTAVRHD